MNFKDKIICIIGTGISGIESLNLISKHCNNIILYEPNNKINIEDIKKKLVEYNNVNIIIDELDIDLINKIDLFIISPGISLNNKKILKIKKLNKLIISEIELAFMFERGNIVSTTGTNGKTTVSTLIYKILKECFEKVFLVGNVGVAYTKNVINTDKTSISVVEVSSFQLETIHKFKPYISIILNISEDHLDRHGSFDEYKNIKESIVKNQDINDYCILNYDDENLRILGEKLIKDKKCKVLFFSSKNILKEGIYIKNNQIIYKVDNKKETVCSLKDLKLKGMHNYENIMASVLVGFIFKVKKNIIKDVILNFESIKFRMEYIGKKNGVSYYNDSKSTNPDSSIKAIKSLNTKIYLIAGGYDKHVSFVDLVKSFDNVKKLLLIGQTANKIKDVAVRNGFNINDIIIFKTLEESVDYAKRNAIEGESVLFSPGCSSYDMFYNYIDRGNKFNKFVNL